MTATGEPLSRQERVLGGEVNTLVDIYGKHERRIYRYCLALLRNPDDAEDATQETFTRAAPFLPNLAGDLSAYLTTVARNICCDVVRARAKRPVPLDNVALPDRAVSPERQSIDWDVVRRMWRQLSPSERQLFAYTFAGYRYEEIASRTGMSRPSVSVGLTRARRRLRELATAIGALGGLPLALRRLLDRGARRAANATASAPQLVASLVDQAGNIAAGLLAGVITAGAATTATTAAAPVLARSHPGTGAVSSAAAPVGRTDTGPGGAVATQRKPPPAAPRPTPAPPAVTRATALLPGGNATPDDVAPTTVTPSPGFVNDGTAFFTSNDVLACPGFNGCPVLFETHDGGAGWTPLWQTTYRGGDVLLPPEFPADPTLFVLDPYLGLESGTAADGGPSLLVPGAVAAAIAPDSQVGHARIAAVTQSGRVVTETVGDGAPSTGPSLPPGITAGDLVFTGPDQVLITGSENVVAGGGTNPVPQQAVLVRCSLTATCASPLAVPADSTLSLAPGITEGGPVVVASMQNVYLSTDGGASVRQIASAAPGRLIKAVALGAGPLGPRILLSDTDSPYQRSAAVRYSDDLGATFIDATGNLTGSSPALLARVLDGGDLLVGLLTGGSHFAMDLTSGNGVWTAAARQS